MNLALGHGEVVRVIQTGPQAPPREFFWRGRRHQVDAWRRPSSREAPAGTTGFRVRTRDGLHCLLVRRRDGRWLVLRVYGKGGAR